MSPNKHLSGFEAQRFAPSYDYQTSCVVEIRTCQLQTLQQAERERERERARGQERVRERERESKKRETERGGENKVNSCRSDDSKSIHDNNI